MTSPNEQLKQVRDLMVAAERDHESHGPYRSFPVPAVRTSDLRRVLSAELDRRETHEEPA